MPTEGSLGAGLRGERLGRKRERHMTTCMSPHGLKDFT